MDFEKTILDLLDNVASFDFNILIRSFLYSLVVIWFFIAVWVWIDSGERTRNTIFRVFSVLLVAPFNIVGLIIYLIMRPKESIESIYWGDLERRYLLYETAELGDCPRCGEQLSPGFNVCPMCSYELKVSCGSCQMMVDRKWNFCPYCKAKLTNTTPEPEEISKEVIRQRVEESRQEIIEQVEVKGTRYKSASSMTERLGRAVLSFIMGIGKGVNDLVMAVVGKESPASKPSVTANVQGEKDQDGGVANEITNEGQVELNSTESSDEKASIDDAVESSIAKAVQEEVEIALENMEIPVAEVPDVDLSVGRDSESEPVVGEGSPPEPKDNDSNKQTGRPSAKKHHNKRKKKKRSR